MNMLDELDDGVGKHGASAMNESVVTRGRPHGGVAIVWNKRIQCKVSPVELKSKRMCAVTIDLEDKVILLVCVYMPCDDRCLHLNLMEFNYILNALDILMNEVDAEYVCIGGDFYTDLDRLTQTQALINFTNDANLYLCANDPSSSVQYSFCSKGTGAKSLIDHFILSENISKLTLYDPVDL